MAIFCSAMAERGGRIESALLKYPDFEIRMPDMGGEMVSASLEYINSLLGTEISGEKAVELLKKARFSASFNGDILEVLVPPYRMDILHQADIAEEIAIAYGYDRFVPELPKEVTFGRRLASHGLKKAIKESLIGLGFNEVLTLTLTSDDQQFRKMRIEKGSAVEIKNPITEFHTSVRSWLIPSLMDILAKNRHRDLPQRIFEIGIVADSEGRNREKVGALLMDDKASFTGIKSIVSALLRDLGLDFSVEETLHPSFIDGRCASVLVEGNEVGFFGEIHPEVLENFDLEHPVSAFEIDISDLKIK